MTVAQSLLLLENFKVKTGVKRWNIPEIGQIYIVWGITISARDESGASARCYFRMREYL